MNSNIFSIFSPIFALIVNGLIQIGSARYIPRLRLLRSTYLGFAIGFIALLVFEIYAFLSFLNLSRDYISIFVVNLIIYASLGYCYFHFVNLGETGRRIRILRELYDFKEGLFLEEILRRYNAKEIIEKRINRLVNNRQVIFKNGSYYIGNPVMLLIARIILTMRLVVFGKIEQKK